MTHLRVSRIRTMCHGLQTGVWSLLRFTHVTNPSAHHSLLHPSLSSRVQVPPFIRYVSERFVSVGVMGANSVFYL